MSGAAAELSEPDRVGRACVQELLARCVAREACPMGVEHRYDAEQMAHHYGASLATIRRYQR